MREILCRNRAESSRALCIKLSRLTRDNIIPLESRSLASPRYERFYQIRSYRGNGRIIFSVSFTTERYLSFFSCYKKYERNESRNDTIFFQRFPTILLSRRIVVPRPYLRLYLGVRVRDCIGRLGPRGHNACNNYDTYSVMEWF